MAERFQAAGLCWSVFLCLILAVLKLTVKADWSWGRVSLPIWALLGHNIPVYNDWSCLALLRG